MKVQTEGRRADGSAIKQSYIAAYDGKEHARPGPWNFNAVINRQISDSEREDIFRLDGKVVGRARLTVSPDVL